MKRILIALIITFITLLSNSCDPGCNCPGGAGYSHLENINSTINHASYNLDVIC